MDMTEAMNDTADDLKQDSTSIHTLELKSIIDKLQFEVRSAKIVNEKFKKRMRKKFNIFFQRYPTLFNMIITKGANFDMDTFKNMLIKRDQILQNEATRFEASKDIGTILLDKYKPNS